MNKLLFFLVVLLTLVMGTLNGCSIFYKIEPEFSQIKKFGFLSVYVNNRFYNRKNYKEDLGLEMLNFFEEEVIQEGKNIPMRLGEYFIQTFKEHLIKSEVTKELEWVPPSKYVGSKVYQSPIKSGTQELDIFNFDDSFQIEENYFTTSQNLKLLPLNKIVKKFNIQEDQENLLSSSVSHQEIGAFADKLGFDGLMVAEIDAAYEKIDFLEGNKFKPSVTIRLLLINKEGQDVLSVGQVMKNRRKIYKGEVIDAQLNGEYLDFNSNPDGISISYRQAIEKAVTDYFKVISSPLF